MASSFEILQNWGLQRASTEPDGYVPNSADFEDHVQTYRSVLKIGMIFVAHIVVIMMAMAFFLTR